MGRTSWTDDELLLLVKAWQESLEEIKAKSGKKKKRPSHLNALIFARFQELSGGSCQRQVNSVTNRREILESSYEYIVSFRSTNDGVEWFALPIKDQKVLMKTAGGHRVQPMQEKVFQALDKFLDNGVAKDNNEESDVESEDSQATEVEGNSSDGDQYQKVMQKKETATPKKAKKSRRRTISKEIAVRKSTLEEESGELFIFKEEAPKPKRQRATAPKKTPSSDLNVNLVLERQSQVLAGFMEKRVEERTKENERSRQEREADQKFWAAETEKDRDLLREIFLKD